MQDSINAKRMRSADDPRLKKNNLFQGKNKRYNELLFRPLFLLLHGRAKVLYVRFGEFYQFGDLCMMP